MRVHDSAGNATIAQLVASHPVLLQHGSFKIALPKAREIIVMP
jgi:hypothetical protein